MTHITQTAARPEATATEIPGIDTRQPLQSPTDRYRANVRLILSLQADEERMRARRWWKFRS
jgi:hypothetical protein